MSEQELNLLQLASCSVAKLCARAPQIVRGKTGKAGFGGIQLDHVPDDALRDAIAPPFPGSANASKYLSGMEVSGMDPLIQCRFDPFRYRDRSNVPALANEIDNGPVLLSLLQTCEL